MRFPYKPQKLDEHAHIRVKVCSTTPKIVDINHPTCCIDVDYKLVWDLDHTGFKNGDAL